jgi:hypothetical protein
MMQSVQIELPLAKELKRFRMPKALDRRLQELLDKQDREGKLTRTERGEAKALVEVSDLLSLLKLGATRARPRRRS